MIDAFSTPRNRMLTLILLAICGLSVIAALAAGIDDNPPGILLAYMAAIALVLAFVHPWRMPGQFRRLLYGSALGLIIFGVLHNVLEGIAAGSGTAGSVRELLDAAGGLFFLIAVLLAPAGLLVGAIGALAMSLRNRHGSTRGPRPA